MKVLSPDLVFSLTHEYSDKLRIFHENVHGLPLCANALPSPSPSTLPSVCHIPLLCVAARLLIQFPHLLCLCDLKMLAGSTLYNFLCSLIFHLDYWCYPSCRWHLG